MEKPTILYVDDEKDQLYLFRRQFEKHFRVLTVQSGEEGLGFLKKEPIQVVIADEKMDSMSGIEFLKECRKVAPNVPRMMLTAYQDEDLLLRAINEGKIHQYLRKPLSGKEEEVVIILQMLIADQAQKQTLERQNEELRKAVLDLKMAQERAMALDRLEHRYRVVNEIGHNVNNPFTAVYTYFQLLEEKLKAYSEKKKKGEVQEKDKEELLNWVTALWGEHVAPQMARVYQELHNLKRFIQDETDPVGDAMSPKKRS
ncbi:MAG: response regulator [Deltaproteobacteria bacterium]|nr:response regulator [Deltaproteobacteria bacterium]